MTRIKKQGGAKRPAEPRCASGAASLRSINLEITNCRACPRLVKWCEQVGREKRAAYRDQTYWAKPVPGFGDLNARLIVVGLAPGAHGANRTGRLFTGDRSGDWLYRALHRAGFANQPTSVSRDDGLELRDAYISAIVRCAPPGNKPEPDERDRCVPFFHRELRALTNARVIVCLGGFAWKGVLQTLAELGHVIAPQPDFAHGSEAIVGPFHLIGSYHPSQQNTFTRRLTEPMFDAIFTRATKLTAG